jgi:hypothetical protein
MIQVTFAYVGMFVKRASESEFLTSEENARYISQPTDTIEEKPKALPISKSTFQYLHSTVYLIKYRGTLKE